MKKKKTKDEAFTAHVFKWKKKKNDGLGTCRLQQGRSETHIEAAQTGQPEENTIR